jgi:hypothetical protein
MTLTTEEMTLLARLLGNHVVGNGELTTLGMKLLDWASPAACGHTRAQPHLPRALSST